MLLVGVQTDSISDASFQFCAKEGKNSAELGEEAFGDSDLAEVPGGWRTSKRAERKRAPPRSFKAILNTGGS